MPSKHRQQRLKDRERKSTAPSTTSLPGQSTAASSASPAKCTPSSSCTSTPSTAAQPIPLQLQWDPGVHEESFSNLNPDDVMQGMVSIETMDYVTQLLNAQFLTSRQYTPSCLYSLSLNQQQRNKVPRHVPYVQIHFCNGHFLVSSQKDDTVTVYDSINNRQHVNSLQGQLDVLYEQTTDIQFRVPQLQGNTNLCAMFATANAITLLMCNDPMGLTFDKPKMRTHLRECIINGHFSTFPQQRDIQQSLVKQGEGVSLANYFKDQSALQESFQQKAEKRRLQILRAVQKKRKDTNYRIIQNKKESQDRRNKRTHSAYKENEVERETTGRKRKRTDPLYQQQETERETKGRRNKRKHETYRQPETERETKGRRNKRKHETYRQPEAERDKKDRKKKRTDPVYQQQETQRETEARRNKRTDPVYQQQETQRETEARRNKRTDPVYQQQETQRETEGRRNKRMDPIYSQQEAERETPSKCNKRNTDLLFREMERERMKRSIRSRRALDKTFRSEEQARDRSVKSRTRRNPEIRQKERERDNVSKQKQRSHPTLDHLIQSFHKDVSEGPTYVCSCCEQLWYRSSVVQASCVASSPKAESCLQGIPSEKDKEWICNTCKNHIKANRIPPCAIVNNMAFPDIPPELQGLHSLELRLVAPRIPFMKIFQAPRGRQFKVHGNVVNVPSNVVQTVSTLPRMQDQDGTIKVKLKRRLNYKSAVMNENIRPYKVMEAAKWLVQNSPLYQRENITLDDNWSYVPTENTEDQDQHENDDVRRTRSQSHDQHEDDDAPGTASQSSDQHEDDWNEVDDTDIHAGTTDTMFTDPNFVEADERDKIWNFAPGQYSQPVSVFRDQHCEELAFPGIFCGQPRSTDRQTNVYYSDIVKSELRRKDRRVAKCVDDIFFKTKKLQMQLIYGKIQIAIRKYKLKDKKITARSLKQEGAISNLLHLDEGYRVLRCIRGSPPYFEKAKKDLFAMIRHLGPATFFMSFSAAETRWAHLLNILSKTVDGKELTEDDVAALTWQEKCRLIQSDSVTCARHFHHSVQCLLKFLRSDWYPLGGPLKDFFYRVEYQHRGSPHIHMLVWVDGAPKYEQNQDAEQTVVDFVDKTISCSSDHSHADMQVHRHSRTCRKGSNKCRFNYPQPPLRKTAVLTPIEDPAAKEEAKKKFKVIKALLEDMKLGEDLDFDQLLLKLQMSEEQYILSVRASISSPTLFLKRSPKDIRVNAYISACLSAWRANMDAQFILDTYACAMYVVGYISKSQRGMSLLLDKACKEAREKGSGIRDQVRFIGNKFTNNVEISAQEAVDICLQVPLRQASRQVVFVPTSPPSERTYFLKSKEDIGQLDDDSDDVATDNMMKRYSSRSKRLEFLTLADWAAFYDSVRQHKKADDQQESASCTDEEEDVLAQSPVKDAIKKRKVARVLRYVRYNKDTHPEEFYRERILLFSPWRNEETLIGSCATFQDRYNQLESGILEQLQKYEPNAAEVDQAEQLAEQEHQDEWDLLAPNTEHENQKDIDEGVEQSDNHQVLDPPENMEPPSNIPTTAKTSELLPFDEMPDEEHRAFIRSLNLKQREFFNDVLHRIKTSDEPFYAFLSGGAGVGKSRLLTAIYQTAMKYYNRLAGSDFNKQHVLVIAPTGKAAFNVFGNTIQSALKVLPNQRFNMDTPTSEKLNTLRSELGDTKLIIIDEISMVGLRLFTLIHRRMQDIMASGDDFGKVSVICFGDLFQFKPVFDCYLFSNDVDGINALATNLWQKHFRMYELTEIMRQRDSVQFAQILNRLREGIHTAEDLKVLETRTCNLFMPNYPTYAPHLFLENSRVALWNDDAFERSTKMKTMSKSHDRVIGDVSLEVERRLKSQIPDNPSKTMHLHTNLKIGLELNFEICLNINTKDGMTNGASGVIKHLAIPPSGVARKGVIWMHFPAEKVGRQTRMDNRHLYKTFINKQWTPIVPVARQLKVGRNGDMMRTQFPLRPSAAKTLHRAQGETFTEVVVDFGVTSSKIRQPFFEHAHYVGLSRVTTLEGLHIRNLNKDKICTNAQVKSEMERLRTKAQYELQSKPTYTLSSSCIISYNNARSLHKHFEDCLKDPSIQASDMCIFSETRIFPSEPNARYHLPGFHLFRNDEVPQTPGVRPSHGSAVYSKMEPLSSLSRNRAGIELSVVIPRERPDVTVISVYKPPQVLTSTLTHVLTQTLRSTSTAHAVVIGDVNSDLNKHPPLQLPEGYKQCLEGPTTDYRTSLDHVYTNLPEGSYESGKTESYWSDHKIVWISI